jgi:hypothetical protein
LEDMKRLDKIIVGIACGLVLSTGARADNDVLANNPYAPIILRNVFSLNPATNIEAGASQVEPPPKITLNGIMSILGKWQALFKVAVPAKPGQPAKDVSYILSEGQRQDDIEIVQIDDKNSLVTFNNHGVVQELPLAKANASSSGAPAAPPAPGGRPAPAQNFSPGSSGAGSSIGNRIPNRFGTRSTTGGPSAAQNRSPGTDGSLPLTTVPTRGGAYGQQSQAAGAILEQAVLLEMQRERFKGTPAEAIIPPTVLTPQLNPAPEGGAQN